MGSQPATRREFLVVAGATAASLVPAVALAASHRGRDLVPGQVVRVRWPLLVPPDRATVVHELDGRVLSRRPAGRPRGFLQPRFEVAAMPADGRMRPGRHDFYLEVPGRPRVWIGGFPVARFRFGC
jgi:hypothetical protein